MLEALPVMSIRCALKVQSCPVRRCGRSGDRGSESYSPNWETSRVLSSVIRGIGAIAQKPLAQKWQHPGQRIGFHAWPTHTTALRTG
jgi:hypothetical protein